MGAQAKEERSAFWPHFFRFRSSFIQVTKLVFKMGMRGFGFLFLQWWGRGRYVVQPCRFLFLPVVVGLTSVSLSGVMLLLRDWVALPDEQEAWKLALEPLIQPPWWFQTRFFEAWERSRQIGYPHSELIWAGSPVIPWSFSRWHCLEDSGCAWGLSVSRSRLLKWESVFCESLKGSPYPLCHSF